MRGLFAANDQSRNLIREVIEMAKARWLIIQVTAEQIAAAKPSDCYECLIALALREATGFSWHVWKDSARIETLCGPLNGRRRTWYFPSTVSQLMRRFDRDERVEPTSFKLPARFADKSWLAFGAGAD
jgi:hypothetical protein